MAHIGMWELIVIFAVVVALFGYRKLPDIGKSLGRGIHNFKRSLREPDEVDITPKKGADGAGGGRE